MSPDRPADPIQHVVLLLLENRSFDQMLGSLQAVGSQLEGIDPHGPPRTNRDSSGNAYPQEPTTATRVDPDPKHELANVLRQIGSPPPDESDLTPTPGVWERATRLFRALVRVIRSWLGRARPLQPEALTTARAHVYEGQFVLDYERSYPGTTPQQRRQVMAYFPLDFLPATHALARHFTVCDHWFASVPGPTWTNRFFALSGTSLGKVRMPESASDFRGLHLYDQDTVFDRLNQQDVPWKVYCGDVPHSLTLAHQLERPNVVRYHFLEQFDIDARGPAAAFPAFSFIEPSYFGPDPDDDHPPHDTMRAQALIARVYNALRSNEGLWPSTLFVVLYDEHGGFFDHVEPPAAVPPDGHAEEYGFDRLGVRIPALLVSPWVARGVVSTVFDHTSLLRYLTDKWDLDPLGERVAQANSIASALRTTGGPRTDTPPTIEVPAARIAMTAPGPETLNEHQQALVAFSEYLESRIEEEPVRKTERRMAMQAGPQAQAEVAKERVQRFLVQEKVKAGLLRPG